MTRSPLQSPQDPFGSRPGRIWNGDVNLTNIPKEPTDVSIITKMKGVVDLWCSLPDPQLLTGKCPVLLFYSAKGFSESQKLVTAALGADKWAPFPNMGQLSKYIQETIKTPI